MVLKESLRASVRHPRLLHIAGASFFAQAAVFAGVQGLPLVMRADHFSEDVIGYAQEAAAAAALLVTRPKRMGHAMFGRLVPLVGLAGAGIAAAVVMLGHGERTGTLDLMLVGVCGLAFIASELLKQWSQSVSRIQARTDAPRGHD